MKKLEYLAIKKQVFTLINLFGINIKKELKEEI
jgi:hypothetical protein